MPAASSAVRASLIRTWTWRCGTRRPGALLEGPAVGELVVRGPNVFSGYWRNAEATAAAFADGWLLTGDVAERDDEGFYRIAGRIKDMVISGGENVYPAEIEDVLHDHAAVLEAAVVGVPDDHWGEACVAFVVLREGVSATEEELSGHCGNGWRGSRSRRASRSWTRFRARPWARSSRTSW